MNGFFALARTPEVVARAFKVSLLVGTILTLINQGDRLIAGMVPDWIKMMLTYLVPYCVSTHGAATAMLSRSQREPRE